MPPKDITAFAQSELCLLQPDGKYIKIGKIQQTNIVTDPTPDFDLDGDQLLYHPMNTATFEVSWNPTTEMIYVLIHGKMPSNNWRKLHGLGVKRKSDRRKRIQNRR